MYEKGWCKELQWTAECCTDHMILAAEIKRVLQRIGSIQTDAELVYTPDRAE